MPSLTEHLLSLRTTPSYSAAVYHPYLKAAANGTLDHHLHALWLSQDRIYAMHAYPRFIGALISKINFSSAHTVSSDEECFNQRILTILASSLEAVIKEGQFFINTAQKFNLPLDGWNERKATRDYTAEMCRVSTSMNIEEGLVFLWAMEKVYFDAWSNVNEGLSTITETNEAKQYVAPFAENWSSPQFSKFVDSLADLVDSLDIKPDSETWYNAEKIWNRVVELEVEFWPNEGEEVSQRIA